MYKYYAFKFPILIPFNEMTNFVLVYIFIYLLYGHICLFIYHMRSFYCILCEFAFLIFIFETEQIFSYLFIDHLETVGIWGLFILKCVHELVETGINSIRISFIFIGNLKVQDVIAALAKMVDLFITFMLWFYLMHFKIIPASSYLCHCI